MSENNSDSQEEVGEVDQPDRRREQRTKVNIGRTILATLEDDTYGEMGNHLYLVEVSPGGMRINLDRNVEPETELRIELPLGSLGFELEGDFEAQCRVVWSKPTAGGTCIVGLEFIKLTEESTQALQSVIDHWRERSGIELRRISRPIDTKLKRSDDEPWSRVFLIRAVSADGCHFRFHQELEKGASLKLRLMLDNVTVVIDSTVRWCDKTPEGPYDIGCQFDDLSDDHEALIDFHIGRCRKPALWKPLEMR